VTKHTKEKSKYFILENGGWYLGFVARRIQIGWFFTFFKQCKIKIEMMHELPSTQNKPL
jgi:hypothetical protein